MAQIKHIARATQDADKTARFYIEVFGLEEIAKKLKTAASQPRDDINQARFSNQTDERPA